MNKTTRFICMLRSKHILSVLTVSAGKAGVAVLSLVTAALVAMNYGQIGLGIFALLRVSPAVFNVVTDPGLSHAIPYLSANRKIERPVLMASGFWFYLAISVLQIGLWTLLAPLIHSHLLGSLSLAAVYAAAILAPMQSIAIMIVNLLRAEHRYNLANSVFLFSEIVLLALIAGSTLLSANNIENVVGYLIVSALVPIFGFSLFLLRGTRPPDLVLRTSVIIEGVKFGLKSQVGNAFQILNYRLDHLLIGIYLTPDKVAVYFIATKAIEFFRFFTTSFMFVFEPIFAAQKNIDAKERIQKMLAPLLLANFALLVVGAGVAPFLYPIIFGAWSTEATAPLMVLGIGLTISGANTLFGAYYLGQGRPGITTLASSAGLLVTAMLAVILIPAYEIIGAAATSSAAYAVVTLIYVRIFFCGREDGEHDRLEEAT